MPARTMGVASKNKYPAAASGLGPEASPPTTVTPEQEIPGIRARTCEVPTEATCENDSSLARSWADGAGLWGLVSGSSR